MSIRMYTLHLFVLQMDNATAQKIQGFQNATRASLGSQPLPQMLSLLLSSDLLNFTQQQGGQGLFKGALSGKR